MAKDNCYLTFLEAKTEAEKRCGKKITIDNRFIPKRLQQLGIYSSFENEERLNGIDDYYCIGYDGRIGCTSNNGVDVNWFAFPPIKL